MTGVWQRLCVPLCFSAAFQGWWAQPGFVSGTTPAPSQPAAVLRVTCFTDQLLFPASWARFVCSSPGKGAGLAKNKACFRNDLCRIKSNPGCLIRFTQLSARRVLGWRYEQAEPQRHAANPAPTPSISKEVCVKELGTGFVLFMSQSQRRPQALALHCTWQRKLPISSFGMRRKLDLSI